MKPEECGYKCVECGWPAPDLYKQLPGGIIKITHCEKCSDVVDKYIEFDNVVILLDVLLHKFRAYRHVLFNTSLADVWKLLLIILLCDAYLKWENAFHTHDAEEDHIFYAALEWGFYQMFGWAIIQWIVFTATVAALVKFRQLVNRNTKENSPEISGKLLIKGLVVACFGRLLAVPAIIWGQTHSVIYLLLTRVFIFTSTVTALRVLCSAGLLFTTVTVTLATLAQFLVGQIIAIHLEDWIMDYIVQ